MKIHRIIAGALQCNCYLIEAENELILVDCGGDGANMISYADRLNKPIGAILLTHGHADHIEGLNNVYQAVQCPIYIHQEDCALLYDADFNLSNRIYIDPIVFNGDCVELDDGEILSVCGLEFLVIHTPGHTRGSVCYRMGDALFTGDTLFKDSVGNEFPPFGDFDLEIRSIRERLFAIGEDLVCYPGHGESTSLLYEKKNNQYCGI